MRRFLVFFYACNRCRHTFQTLSDPGDEGIRLLFSEKTNIPACVSCDFDPAFPEVQELLRTVLGPKELSTIQFARLFDSLFGDICDLAPDGSKFNMTGKRKCPQCGSNDLSFGPSVPPVYEETDIPSVRHTKWDASDLNEKRNWISSLLKRERF
jgi:hypothetical protein